MILPISSEDTINKIRRAYMEIQSPYNDGFNQWNLKRMLYEIKFELDYVLKNSNKFHGEEEFLDEQEKKQIWRELKK